jgi:hypothetical protein
MGRTMQDSVSGRDEIFLLYKISTPRLGPTERPVRWVTGVRLLGVE